jgi:hypothetical protein
MPIIKTYENVGAVNVYHKAGLTGTPLLVSANARGIAGWHIKNTTAAAAYVAFFDAAVATDVTLATTVPLQSIGIEASGKSELFLGKPIPLTSGLVVAGVTTADGNTGAASDVDIYWI